MKLIAVAVLALASTALFAQQKPAEHKAEATITDAQRLRFRELERDYAQQQIVITQAQAAQAAAQAAGEKQAKIQGEAQDLIKSMQATCKATEDFDGTNLKCNPKTEAPKK